MLTTVGDISEQEWNERYDWMSKRNDEYFLLCILDGSGENSGEGRIVGTGAVLVERKLYVSFYFTIWCSGQKDFNMVGWHGK